MSMFKKKDEAVEVVVKSVAHWRVRFYRKARKFDLTCEHLRLSLNKFSRLGDTGSVHLINILEEPLDDVGYDVSVEIDNIISIERLDPEDD